MTSESRKKHGECKAVIANRLTLFSNMGGRTCTYACGQWGPGDCGASLEMMRGTSKAKAAKLGAAFADGLWRADIHGQEFKDNRLSPVDRVLVGGLYDYVVTLAWGREMTWYGTPRTLFGPGDRLRIYSGQSAAHIARDAAVAVDKMYRAWLYRIAKSDLAGTWQPTPDLGLPEHDQPAAEVLPDEELEALADDIEAARRLIEGGAE